MKDQNPFISQTLNSTNKNAVQNNLIIPIELKNQNLKSYLSLSTNDNNNLFIYLNKTSEELNDEMSKIKNQINENIKLIQNYENILKEKDSTITKLQNSINEKEKEIELEKNNISIQENKLNELISSVNDLGKYLISSKQNSKSEFLHQKFSSISYTEHCIITNIQKDLKDYQEYINEKISYKKPVINDILKELQATVDEVNPNYKVNLYGSYCTGLCLPWSDIDTVITCESGQTDEYFLSRLYCKLTNKPWVRDHKFIENTTIPIIKLISNDKFNFHIDISEESEKHFGLKTVELVKSYLKEYSVLEPIILALKTLLNNGNLNNPYTGGLSSYGLILMVVSFIQSEIDNEKYNEKSPNILGETFLNVLGHYGIFFDYNNYVIITYPVDDTNDISDRDNSFSFVPNSHELIIVDPLNKQNNVAKSTFQFMNIKMGFLIAFMVAKEDCECGCHYGCMQNHLDKTEHCILKRIFNSIKRFKDANKNLY